MHGNPNITNHNRHGQSESCVSNRQRIRILTRPPRSTRIKIPGQIVVHVLVLLTTRHIVFEQAVTTEAPEPLTSAASAPTKHCDFLYWKNLVAETQIPIHPFRCTIRFYVLVLTACEHPRRIRHVRVVRKDDDADPCSKLPLAHPSPYTSD